ncbi:MAG: hypothetical protein ACRETQ_09820 [Gammaproteobacteria bacterium]
MSATVCIEAGVHRRILLAVLEGHIELGWAFDRAVGLKAPPPDTVRWLRANPSK